MKICQQYTDGTKLDVGGICDQTKPKTKSYVVAGSLVNATLYMIGRVTIDLVNPGKYAVEFEYNRTLQFEKAGAPPSLIFRNDGANAQLKCADFGSTDLTLRNIVLKFQSSSSTADLVNIEGSTPATPLMITNFKFYPGITYDKAILDAPYQYFYEGDPTGIFM